MIVFRKGKNIFFCSHWNDNTFRILPNISKRCVCNLLPNCFIKVNCLNQKLKRKCFATSHNEDILKKKNCNNDNNIASENNNTDCNKNLFVEELNNVFKEFPLENKNNLSNEDIFISINYKEHENKQIGSILKMDDNTYGIVLQLNKNDTIIGRIKNVKKECIENLCGTDLGNMEDNKMGCTNVYSPYEYLNYLYLKNCKKINIFNINNKEMFSKMVITKQLYTNNLLIDLFYKINYGQKICIIGEKDQGKQNLLNSIIYENLLVNLIKENENFFIICSTSHKSEITSIFQKLYEQFRKNKNWLDGNGEKNNDDQRYQEETKIDKLYSKNYTYENIKIPNDILLINSVPQNDTKVATYVSPVLSTYNLHMYKNMYKNVILIFYDVEKYSNIVLDLQKEMNILIKNYYEKKENIKISSEKYGHNISTLPFSMYTILSRYLSLSMYPYIKYQNVNDQLKDDSKLSKMKNGKLDENYSDGNIRSLGNFKYSDLVNMKKEKNENSAISINSTTTFLFLDNNEKKEMTDIKNYALSLCENSIYIFKNKLGIYPEININNVIKNCTIENNKIWEYFKHEIRQVFDKRKELMELNENKKMMNIYIDHWENEDLIHYNNIYYILMYNNSKIFNLNTFYQIIFLKILFSYNFTNENISQKSIQAFYKKFFYYYFRHSKYFSHLHAQYYTNLSSFQKKENAHNFLQKIETILRYTKPYFS
ncbi:conserved Plasmodium protein, unknown function [Plasmodium berghei]|uniref:Uncharacterized protein n=2 Tax=Plasmodium berghei TaxID=5821 RepID=A0A509AQP6_PLABA|nr:conserved Plasmodium protein, unknown function [Plasmodium berghei ANKA]CXJ02144.1 conserved Plasmodium protein, unknown function [Plasmodium berghei]SCL98271.1 conserved Plasmodium protein, unknown function [Plasmodium berghei]SCM16795.1 conserved Plasmodium protein, unknown function [Plasmodium berghei]SCN28028.1 conserved Plasmodium protein, unknown function [Plasmodium berghei]VUC57909.1 conserved Plasmodium protein, unknown function [Plasmodium berghei ANKA]|eukprot:XP_034423679.1 conserved Plasmodium protein, unknown function [Plasmodium berghei ANKA]